MSGEENAEQVIKTVLVTGASGFIATHIVQQLIRTGYGVRGTVRSLKDQQKVQAIWDVCTGPRSSNRLLLVQADLLDERCWDAAVEGCTYVMHVASPTPKEDEKPQDEDRIIQAAVQGTLSILKACVKSTTVKRVIMTSSIAAIAGALRGGDYTENDWADENRDYMGPYEKSKLLAESAAWDFVKRMDDENAFEFVVMNPGLVLGPALCGTFPTSLDIGKAMLTRTIPFIPRVNIPIVDVRDVATAHLRAMTSSVTPGKRILLTSGNLWYRDMADICAHEFAPHGYVVMTCDAPDFLVKIGTWFPHNSKFYTAGLGRVTRFDNRRMRRLLGLTPVDVVKSVVDMCYGLIDKGFVPKTEQYRPRN